MCYTSLTHDKTILYSALDAGYESLLNRIKGVVQKTKTK